MIKLVAFDLDGTLVNSLEDLADSTNYTLKQLGFPEHDVDQYRYFIGNGIAKLLERALPSDRNSGEVFEKARVLFDRHYQQNYCNKTAPYEQIPELIAALEENRFKIAVLSNKPDEFVRHILDELFPEASFDFVLGASETLPKKPAPDTLLACLEELRMDPEECIYCGDSDVDVLYAHSAGIQVIGASWGFRGSDELSRAGADYIIDHPSELPKLLDILN